MAHPASKIWNFVRIGQSGLQKLQFYLFIVLSTNSSKKSLKKSLSTHPVSRHGSTSTLFASCSNGLDCHQYIWKVSSHRIENPDILVSKCSAILAECASGCCIQVKMIKRSESPSEISMGIVVFWLIRDIRLKFQLKSIE